MEYYRINVVGCHKPWNNTSVFFTTDKDVFEVFSLSPESMLYDIEFPGNAEDGIYEWMDEVLIRGVVFPYTILDEVTVYTE